MVFSSLTFLLIFLPVTALLYYLPDIFSSKKKSSNMTKFLSYKNLILCIASLLFYAWGEPVNILLMLISILFNYVVGLDMKKHEDNEKHRKFLLILALVFDIGILAIFKYSGFVTENISLLTGSHIALTSPTLPIGISFYTFQILSYVIDVYRKQVRAQDRIVDFALYISMFPQLIAGPIVQYSAIEKQLRERTVSVSAVADGIYLFVIGLAKKVIFANFAGSVFEELSAEMSGLTFFSSWLAIIFYAFQIYYDFSGYSDMARGLGGMFGFEFPENFNYPYAADSITDFWRRWHITLSSWFRDYVYIPLGGNRCSSGRNIFNLFIVWSLTGLWHGAAWNFVLWGIYYFVLLTCEKYLLKNIIKKIPSAIRRIITFIFVIFGWVLFSSEDMTTVKEMFLSMFGYNGFVPADWWYILTNNGVMLLLMGVLSVPLFDVKDKRNKAMRIVIFILLFGISIICLVGDTYNPFLYFRF